MTDELEQRLAEDLGAPPPMELIAGLRALGEDTARAAEDIDVTAAVAARVRRTGVLIRLGHIAPLAAAAVVLIFLAQQMAMAAPVRVVAERGTELWEDGRWRALEGEHALPAPVQLRTERGRASVDTEKLSAELSASTEVVVATAAHLTVAAGSLSLEAREPVLLTTPHGDATAQGRLRVLVVRGPNMTRPQKLAALLGGAGAVIALYSGTLRLGRGEGAETLRAPSAALLDERGGARRIALADAEAALAGHAAERSQPTRGDAVPGEPSRTGGFWNESVRAIHFTLAGEVFDAQSGAPVEAFEAELSAETLRSYGVEPRRTQRFTGAADGRFKLEGLGLGTYTLVVRAPGYAPSRQSVQLHAATDDPYLVVPLSQGAQLSGTVVDWRDQVIEGAEVGLGGCRGDACPTTTTGADGAFLLSGAPEDEPFTLVGEHPRYGRAALPDLRLTAGETRHVTLKLSGVLKVFGQVRRGEGRAPAQGLVVRTGETSTVTDAAGRYEILVPLSSRPQVRVVLAGRAGEVEVASYPDNRSSEPIRWVQADTHVAELEKDFVLEESGATLRGRITDASGRPVARASVLVHNTLGWASRDHDTFPEATVTSEDGVYLISDIPAQAGYRLELDQGGERRLLGTVVIDEPREVVADFTLGTAQLRGRFVDADTKAPFALGEQACGRVGLVRGDAIYPVRCLADGGFEATSLPPGRYRIERIAPQIRADLEVVPRDVEVGAEAPPVVDVAVRGKRFVTWTLRVVDAAGRFVAGPTVRYYYSDRGSRTWSLEVRPDGTVTFAVPEDQAEVFIDAPGYQPSLVPLAELDADSVFDVRMHRAE